MSTRSVSSSSMSQQLTVEETRPRTAHKEPKRSFGTALAVGADVVLRGVEVGATISGGPLVGAAVRTGRVALDQAAGGETGASLTGSADPAMADAAAMQELSHTRNMEYLALQQATQDENRSFTTLSNVMKAKHDTAKAAIGNIRS